ncbi:MAG TPA: 3-deoxy-D-manno-octulosonic acid kinase [Steroidobacteraceae bacterium]|nr:3-deoxy-D-manno-octulosonic acid kinase [Steroidobacteraceae bacterium]
MAALLNRDGPRSEQLRRTALRGPAGHGAWFTAAAFGSEVGAPWFEPRYWISRGAVVGKYGGRGTALVFEHRGQRYVLRHYRRGGLAAFFSHDDYLWLGESRARPVAELRVLLELHAAGLPVPAPVAARYLRSGATYRADLITLQLPGTYSLAARLDQGELSLAGWQAVGRCIRRFHDHGLCHADLNAHNILLRNDEEVFLVDFDRARRRRPGLWRDANLARLRRSLDALDDTRRSRRCGAAEWQCLLAAWL